VRGDAAATVAEAAVLDDVDVVPLDAANASELVRARSPSSPPSPDRRRIAATRFRVDRDG
jgi:hypothetical protein